MIKLRLYQEQIKKQGYNILLHKCMLYLAMEVRTGKTITALSICNEFKVPINVLFVTKKKAIASVEKDFKATGYNYNLTVINYESLHNIDTSEFIDIIICDEAHCFSSYPKPSKRYKDIKSIIDKHKYTKVIFLSGTPSPESKSQLFHQFRVSDEYSPFKEYVNFYKWAKTYVEVTKKRIAHGNEVNDYSKAKDWLIDAVVRPYFITYTQEQAGFESTVNERILYCDMKPHTYKLISTLKKDLVVQGKEETILADTGVKLQGKIHQLCSGTIKFESGNSKVLDNSKAEFIKKEFRGKKIAIFYIFKEEFNLLKQTFTNWTDSPEEFNESQYKVFLGQIRSNREGVNLSTADALIYYNIEFSALCYIQGRDRMTSKDRTKDNNVYFIFAKGGIEQMIYDRVKSKEDYTLKYFCDDFGVDKNKFKHVQKELF